MDHLDIDNKKEHSGFVNIEQIHSCFSSEHYPPTHLHIPYGKKYIHICPDCGNRSELNSSQARL